MKYVLLIIGLMAPAISFAQRVVEYKASNGITYKVGDTIKLGRGSGLNGNFLFFQYYWRSEGPAAVGPRIYTNASLVINKMKMQKLSGNPIMVFTVKPNYDIRIEEAINACEVLPCNEKPVATASVADELLKLKKLMDSGILTSAEFETQKKKLLQN